MENKLTLIPPLPRHRESAAVHPAEYFSFGAGNTQFRTLGGVPAGVTLSISGITFSNNRYGANAPKEATLTFSCSGNFTTDWALTITAKFSAWSHAEGDMVPGPIPVRVGSVSGQATGAGGTATFPVRLWTQPSAAVTVSVSSRDTGEGTASPSSLVFSTSDWNTAMTATLSGPSSQAVTLMMAATAVSGDFTLTGTKLTIAAGATLTITEDDYGLDVGSVTGQATEPGARRRSLWRC